ncbi:hypothetical protein OA253_04025 [Alphaproteobacteria bacterium]|nr:hypothetical protein [Alphaproteobacteria bacterium]
MLNYFKITHIPKVKWSSDSPFNIKPNPKTIFFLFFGLTLFGLGESLLIVSNFGVTPWTVFAEGVAKNFDISIGLATFLVSISILILWVPLKQKIGIGTISNAIIIAFTIDLFVYLLPSSANSSANTFFSILEMIIGILLVGIGSGIYLITNLGPGTRDGLMKGISENFQKPIYLIRLSIEIIVVILGWLLGGTVGLGTLMFAVLIGPIISVSLIVIKRTDN